MLLAVQSCTGACIRLSVAGAQICEGEACQWLQSLVLRMARCVAGKGCVRCGAMAARAEAQPALACFWLTDALQTAIRCCMTMLSKGPIRETA